MEEGDRTFGQFPIAGWQLYNSKGDCQFECMSEGFCVCMFVPYACQSQSESECVATLPERVSKSVVISEEFTVGCLPVVGAGGSY